MTIKCAPIDIGMMLNVYCMPQEIWAHNNSEAGLGSIRRLQEWAMIKPNEHGFYSLTDRGKAWIERILEVPKSD